jgi:hypothetical protein
VLRRQRGETGRCDGYRLWVSRRKPSSKRLSCAHYRLTRGLTTASDAYHSFTEFTENLRLHTVYTLTFKSSVRVACPSALRENIETAYTLHQKLTHYDAYLNRAKKDADTDTDNKTGEVLGRFPARYVILHSKPLCVGPCCVGSVRNPVVEWSHTTNTRKRGAVPCRLPLHCDSASKIVPGSLIFRYLGSAPIPEGDGVGPAAVQVAIQLLRAKLAQLYASDRRKKRKKKLAGDNVVLAVSSEGIHTTEALSNEVRNRATSHPQISVQMSDVLESWHSIQ